ncbi:hypothetical protein [Devosia aurantiaca]|uniref:Uncharacterized protein n=1 Tax=Devosia aurantiaca TaxID=2714858 RepID=A0A6M1SER2_9HYPH|nr:hypothetical protein [Devosia aurantiaca]NGP18349.1 hypothetical protein [Devosia aurantiaca]
MNRIVRQHYPVEKLPEDLREHFPDAEAVTVSVLSEPAQPFIHSGDKPRLSLDETFARLRSIQQRSMENGGGVTAEEAVRRVRELRDEWGD